MRGARFGRVLPLIPKRGCAKHLAAVRGLDVSEPTLFRGASLSPKRPHANPQRTSPVPNRYSHHLVGSLSTATCCYLLLPAAACCCLLLPAVACCYLLLPAATCCYLLLLPAAATCCCLLLLPGAATCCHLLAASWCPCCRSSCMGQCYPVGGVSGVSGVCRVPTHQYKIR